ncbi:MAG: hypothetical protein ABSE73_20735, partial [Planctomycetota bacterium]
GGLSVLPAAGTDEAAPNSRRGHIRGTRNRGIHPRAVYKGAFREGFVRCAPPRQSAKNHAHITR